MKKFDKLRNQALDLHKINVEKIQEWFARCEQFLNSGNLDAAIAKKDKLLRKEDLSLQVRLTKIRIEELRMK